MIDARLPLALEGGLALPKEGRIAVVHPPVDATLAELPQDRVTVFQDSKVACDAFTARGFDVAPQLDGMFALTVLCLPRAKAQARAMVATAAAASDVLVVDGQKTDGADSVLKELRKRVAVEGPISKAHGKIFWTRAAGDAFADWAQGPALTEAGFWSAPGVFSADGIDPASALLADGLPASLGKRVADLGAGWGFLSAHILTREDVKEVHLVEAGHLALECARRNVTDPRAVFHWTDATRWQAPAALDTVVMNPPFHTGRAAEPSLGQAFIATAAAQLSPRGSLWMVANRHLPYETTLTQHFAQVAEVGGDNRFKLLHAARPSRKKR